MKKSILFDRKKRNSPLYKSQQSPDSLVRMSSSGADINQMMMFSSESPLKRVENKDDEPTNIQLPEKSLPDEFSHESPERSQSFKNLQKYVGGSSPVRESQQAAK